MVGRIFTIPSSIEERRGPANLILKTVESVRTQTTLNAALITAIAEFGEVKEYKFDYSMKKQPLLVVGKHGSIDNELNATGLALDEVNQLIYIADSDNKRI